MLDEYRSRPLTHSLTHSLRPRRSIKAAAAICGTHCPLLSIAPSGRHVKQGWKRDARL